MPPRFLGPWAFLQGMGGCSRVILESVGCGCSSGVEQNLAKVGVEGSNPLCPLQPALSGAPAGSLGGLLGGFLDRLRRCQLDASQVNA